MSLRPKRHRPAHRRIVLGLTMAAGLVPLSSAAAPPARPKPMRIMSMNMCTDMLVLQLAPKASIVSVTYLAHDAIGAIQEGLDTGVGVNHGAAEELLTQKPDMLITGDFSTAMTRKLAKQMGLPMIEVKSATTFDDIRANARQVGAAVGEPARAEALIAEMDRTLARLAATAPPKPYVVAAWSGDAVPGKLTLANTIIEAAGAVNVASLLPNNRYNTFGVEQLLAARPQVLMYASKEDHSMTTAASHHRAVRKLYAHRQVTYPDALYTCGLPQSARAAAELRQLLIDVTGRRP